MISTAENGVADPGQVRGLSGTASADEARRATVPFHGLLLVAALAGALFAQGGYYPSAQWPVAVLLAGALIIAVRAHPLSTSDVCFAPLAACVVLAGWMAARAAVLGDVTLAMGTVAMLAGLAATVVVARRTPAGDGLDVAAVGLGLAVAMTGWLGVAWRISHGRSKTRGSGERRPPSPMRTPRPVCWLPWHWDSAVGSPGPVRGRTRSASACCSRGSERR